MSEAEYNAALPADVYPESRGRLPLVRRDELDTEGKARYDRYTSPDSTSLAGLQGPGGLRLHANADRNGPSRIDDRIEELVRLALAREMDQQFEWTLHEPAAVRAGVDSEIIDVIRYRHSLAGVPDAEAAIIRMVRELFQEHRISPDTYKRLTAHFGRRDLIKFGELIGGGIGSFSLAFLFDVHLPHDREPRLPID